MFPLVYDGETKDYERERGRKIPESREQFFSETDLPESYPSLALWLVRLSEATAERFEIAPRLEREEADGFLRLYRMIGRYRERVRRIHGQKRNRECVPFLWRTECTLLHLLLAGHGDVENGPDMFLVLRDVPAHVQFRELAERGMVSTTKAVLNMTLKEVWTALCTFCKSSVEGVRVDRFSDYAFALKCKVAVLASMQEIPAISREPRDPISDVPVELDVLDHDGLREYDEEVQAWVVNEDFMEETEMIFSDLERETAFRSKLDANATEEAAPSEESLLLIYGWARKVGSSKMFKVSMEGYSDMLFASRALPGERDRYVRRGKNPGASDELIAGEFRPGTHKRMIDSLRTPESRDRVLTEGLKGRLLPLENTERDLLFLVTAHHYFLYDTNLTNFVRSYVVFRNEIPDESAFEDWAEASFRGRRGVIIVQSFSLFHVIDERGQFHPCRDFPSCFLTWLRLILASESILGRLSDSYVRELADDLLTMYRTFFPDDRTPAERIARMIADEERKEMDEVLPGSYDAFCT